MSAPVTFHIQPDGDWQVRVSGLIVGRICKLSVGVGWQYRPRGHYFDSVDSRYVGPVCRTVRECMQSVMREEEEES